MCDECVAQARAIAGRNIRTGSTDDVVLDLTLRIIAAIDSDAERIFDLVSLHHHHRHLGQAERPKGRSADIVRADHHLREMSDDALAPAKDRATFDETGSQVEAERDIDSLRIFSGGRVDEAVANLDARPPRLDAVETRSGNPNMLDGDVVRAVDLDADLAAGNGDVSDRDVVGGHDDSAAHDSARFADELLRMVDQEGPLMDSGGQVNRGRLSRPGDPAGGCEERDDGRNRRRAGGSELSPVLAVRELHEREGSMDEGLS